MTSVVLEGVLPPCIDPNNPIVLSPPTPRIRDVQQVVREGLTSSNFWSLSHHTCLPTSNPSEESLPPVSIQGTQSCNHHKRRGEAASIVDEWLSSICFIDHLVLRHSEYRIGFISLSRRVTPDILLVLLPLLQWNRCENTPLEYYIRKHYWTLYTASIRASSTLVRLHKFLISSVHRLSPRLSTCSRPTNINYITDHRVVELEQNHK